MRIACIHIPQFALQCTTRLDPALRGAPVAVVSSVDPGAERRGPLHAPIVLACSRAAWSLGVRLGMTATAARALSAELRLVTAEPALEREAARAVADALLAVTSTVDIGGRVGAGGAHLAMYAEVPAKTRGTSFGERLAHVLEELGYSARIGIADDRFTAWVAAAHAGSEDSHGHTVTSVPRGGSPAFLAPRPLALLAITPEVQHMLEALGVRTLGEFAALPAPSVHRPLEADYQALARGESGTQLRPYAPEAPIREDVIVSAGNVLERDGSVSGPAGVALVARRIALRLEGRGRSAARLDVTIERAGERHEIPIVLARPAASPEELARELVPVLDGATDSATTWRLRVVVSGEAVPDAAGTVTEVFAEGSSPFARTTGASNSNDSIYARDDAELRDLTEATSSTGTGTEPSSLAVVLASTGALFSLSPPAAAATRSERRDAHRRTQRGKQRRARPLTASTQPRLFDRTSSK